MILVDANILLYAEDSLNSHHDKARKWLDGKLSGTETICLCWTVLAAFIRIGTNARVFEAPLSLEQATTRVQSWLDQPNTRLINPTDQHWRVFQQLLLDSKALANLVKDAHIAALAIEHGCEVASSDSDFARFPKLKWFNPLV
ncbi:MAG: type II toxin-antitoxin system VapC family toxin [Desulfobacteraceae bacterium]|nr:type II toxin-antitoxin system VapC family toxin [Desulfobacteraceae bacterium]MBU4001413.1 type II toxin-antitoxin system VapC family toxin [Pseudomonadota bacterium]MBU4054177.1 type II toxin-antitoxin system VapC family toxin [Pseudomonadota bacterium]